MRPCSTLLCILLVAGVAAAWEPAQVEPDARRVLQEMVRAYRGLRSLEMETKYYGDSGGFNKPVRSRLVFQRPNRLLYEVWQNVLGMGRTTVKRYLCDGRHFYVYDEAEQYYTRDKAPRDFKGLGLLGAGIEFVAISGMNPFANLEQQVRAARLSGTAEVNGEMADVVVLDSGTADRTGEARFYISRTHRLILRFSFESVPLSKPAQHYVPPPEPLNPDDPPEQELKPLPVKFGYDNQASINPRVPASVFAWTTPPGSLLYEPLNQMLDRRNAMDRPAYVIVGKDGKPVKPVTYRQLLEMARKRTRNK